jgi:putative ABC transport system permease protein
VGRVLLAARLAARDLRRRPSEAALLLLAITGATTVLTIGLVLEGVTDKPYQRTRHATAGPDVVAVLFPRVDRDAPPDPADVKALTGASGVVSHSGPYPTLSAVLEANGRTVTAQAEGRDATAAAVDRPKLTKGAWVRDGGVVLEAAFAGALGVGPGDRVTLKPLDDGVRNGAPPTQASGPGRSFTVAGVAVTAATPPYPEPACMANVCMGSADTGLIWVTRKDARRLNPEQLPVAYVLNLRLADPAAAPAFVAERNPPPDTSVAADAQRSGRPAGLLQAWQDIRAQSANLVENQRRALVTGAWLLALLAVASVAVLVGGRMADQIRRVGLLKAVGGTPGLVAAVLLAEYVAVALAAAATGLALGSLTAPLITDASAGLLGSAGAQTVTLSTAGVVTAVAVAVAVAATLVPAVRAARTSTVLALADAARPPRRTAWLIALSARMPAPLLLGMRVAARRPRRTLLAVLSIAITVSGLVAALIAHADVLDGSNSDRAEQLNRVLLALTITLVALAAVNAIFITWATALDARHSSALARALGAAPQQVGAALSAAQLLPALAGAILGIPGGFALTALADPDGGPTPPLWQLLAVVPATVLVVAALTAIPARISARRPAGEVLHSELA